MACLLLVIEDNGKNTNYEAEELGRKQRRLEKKKEGRHIQSNHSKKLTVMGKGRSSHWESRSREESYWNIL